jgi:hypothetical protein
MFIKPYKPISYKTLTQIWWSRFLYLSLYSKYNQTKFGNFKIIMYLCHMSKEHIDFVRTINLK